MKTGCGGWDVDPVPEDADAVDEAVVAADEMFGPDTDDVELSCVNDSRSRRTCCELLRSRSRPERRRRSPEPSRRRWARRRICERAAAVGSRSVSRGGSSGFTYMGSPIAVDKSAETLDSTTF